MTSQPKKKNSAAKQPPKIGSIQQHFVSARAIRHNVIELAPTTARRNADFAAIIEIEGVNMGMMSEDEEMGHLSSYHGFLNSLPFPFQIVVRSQPMDMRPYLLQINALAKELENDLLRRIANDHIRYVLRLLRERTILERRFLIVVTSQPSRLEDTEDGSQQFSLKSILDTFGLFQKREVRQDVRRELAIINQRIERVMAGAAAMGLTAYVLEGQALAQAYYESWNYEEAVRAPMMPATLGGTAWPLSTDPDRPSLAPSRQNGRSGAGGLQPPRHPSGQPSKSGDGREYAGDVHAAPPGRQQRSPADAERGVRVMPPSKAPAQKATSAAKNQTNERFVMPRLRDYVAPSSIVLKRDMLILDHMYMRSFAVSGYPRYINSGWLANIIEMGDPIELTIHVNPEDSKAALRQLTRRLAELEASANLTRTRGQMDDMASAIGIEDLSSLREQIERGAERFFSTSIYITVRGGSKDILESRSRRITNAFENMQVRLRPCIYEQDMAFLSCVPEGRDRLRRTFPHDTTTVAMSFPFITSNLTMSEGVFYGTSPNGSPIIVDSFSPMLENSNKVIFAKSGAGKSFGCKVEAMRNLMRGIDTYIIDPEDEYWPVAEAVGGQVVRLSVGSHDRINPFDVHTDYTDLNHNVISEKIQSLQLFMNILLGERTSVGIEPLSQREKSLIDLALKRMYERFGITNDPATHHYQMPLLADLYDIIVSGECGVDSTMLSERLLRYINGSNMMFSEPTNVTLDNPFIVFNIRDMDPDMRPLALFLITDFIWEQIRTRERRPRQLIIDEAWTLMQFTEGGQFLSGLARRARKYFLGLVTITQDVRDFLRNEYGQTILANSSLKLLMRQDNTTIDVVSETFQLTRAERSMLMNASKGQGIFFMRQSHVNIQIEASPMEYALATSDPRELARRS